MKTFSLYKPKDTNKVPPNALNPFFWQSLLPATAYVTTFLLVSFFSVMYAPNVFPTREAAFLQFGMLLAFIHLIMCFAEFNKYWSANANDKIASTDFYDYKELAKDLIRERGFLSSWDYWKLNYMIQDHKRIMQKGANKLDENLETRLKEQHPTLFS